MALQQPAIPREHYRYVTEGCRAVKAHLIPRGSASPQQHQVRYLPGLEVRITIKGGRETARRLVSEVGCVRINREAAGRTTLPGGHLRFSLSDRSGSMTIELDDAGKLVSSETYYPFGGTAMCQAETKYKTKRYSGKERDVTGLVYYGWRYYAPWLMRWINTDPAGMVDGLNLFRMTRNNPLTLKDIDGRAPIDVSRLRTVKDFQYTGFKSGFKHLGQLDNEELGVLNLNKENSAPIEVDDRTLKLLVLAQNTNLKTKELIPYGSSNMEIDVWRTGGKNIGLRREALLSSEGDPIENTIRYGAGNCGEHTQIAYRLLSWQGLTSPVHRARDTEVDHNYVLIGDPRESNRIVVADSWVTLPTSHLAHEGRFSHPEIGHILETAPPGRAHDPKYAIDDNLELNEPVLPPLDLTDYLSKNRNHLFCEYSSLKSVGRSYTHEKRIYRFDLYPESELNQFINDQRTFDRQRR